ncbi:hypothetical protein KR200_000943 [Drosophila serrata]|nr:hypothetical protein KR200_000943 [Drosophila serrata]
MPFGLTNAAQRLCRLMDKVIPQRLRENVFMYLDDLLVVSPTFEEHLETLREVAELLKEAGLTIGLKKSHFCFKELRYLGFIIGGGVLRTDPKKLARKLRALEDNELEGLEPGDRFALLRDTIRRNLHEAHETSARNFDRQTREITFQPGQEAFRRNRVLSDFGRSFNAKFARKFVKCRIRRPIGNHMYEVEDLNGKLAGVFHVRDLKQ